MERWLERGVIVRIVSLLLAIALWFSVTNAQRAAQVQRTVEGIDIQVRNLPEGYAVAEIAPETVNVTVRADARDINRYSRSDFIAWVNMQGPLQPGETDFAIERISVPRGVTLLGYSPDKVRIKVEEIVETSRPVGVTVNGKPAVGYSHGPPAISPSEIVLRGPGSLLAEIAAVWVAVDIAGANTDVERDLPVIMVDATGQPVTGVQAIPNRVHVRVPIQETEGTKIVPVQPDVIGQPAEGYSVGEISITPSEIVISGTETALQQIDAVRTASVDISGAESSLEQIVALLTPPDVEAKPASVTVRIRIDQSN